MNITRPAYFGRRKYSGSKQSGLGRKGRRMKKEIAILSKVRALVPGLLICTILGQGCRSPSVDPPANEYPIIAAADESGIPDSVRNAYREDASRLALRYLEAVSHPMLDSVRLPSILVGSLYNALLHLYLRTNLPQRDTIVSIFEIHTFPHPETHRIIIAADSNKPWMKEFRSGKNRTGYLLLDSTMDEFGLSLVRYYAFSWMHYVVLTASDPLNIDALSKVFEQLDGVADAGRDGWVGDGNDIRVRADGMEWKFTFSLGYGDCPAGCISRHYWDFTIDELGGVRFLASYGSPLPPLPLE